MRCGGSRMAPLVRVPSSGCAVALEDGARKGLGQHVGDVMVRRHEVDGDEASVDPLADGLDAHVC